MGVVCVCIVYLCSLSKGSIFELLDVYHTASVEGGDPDNGPAPW